ncbi:MAG: ABC transporter ATP-binding protein [Pseudomonadota bacterium]
MAETAPVLEVEGLGIAINGLPTVDGLSLSVGRGETVALPHESGCGKSISALAVMGLLPGVASRTDGRIRLEDQDLTALDEPAMAKLRGDAMAMIFQEPTSSLNPLMRVGHQITESLEIHRGLSGRRARRAALDMLDQVGIPNPETRYDQFPFELSGGMCQRIMIATALICEPRLLIADEPTTALDVTIQAQILELMKRLREETGTALLLITHDMGVVADMADRVVVMYAGRAVETADVDDLFDRQGHPYTRLLMGSIPTLDGARKTRLAAIPGTVPDIANWPEGCRFAPRCPLVSDICRTTQPPLEPFAGPSHRSACHHADAVESLT